MKTETTPTVPHPRKRYTRYVVGYLAATIGSVWALALFYLINFDVAVAVLGNLELTNPIVVVILHSPAIAAVVIILFHDGLRGLANFARTLIPRRKDYLWLLVLMAIMALYIFAVRYLCILFGLPVPANPQAPLEMLVTWLQLLIMEIGMLAITVGWFGFFLPYMHRVTKSHVLSGVATGVGIGVFVAPGNLFSSFELATAWPLYVGQLCVLSIGMSLLLSRMKGNILFFLMPFWVSASGSAMRLYYFTAATQVVQFTLFAVLVGVLYLVLKRQAPDGVLDAPHTFPEYLENAYTVRMGAVVPGSGDRSAEAPHGAPAGELTSAVARAGEDQA